MENSDKHVTPPSRNFLDAQPKKHYSLPAMKTLIPLTAIAALAASGLTYAQSSTAAFSKPSGYVTQNLSQGFNLVGLTLLNSPAASGTFEAVTQTTLTDSQLTFSPLAGRTYVLEFVSGAASGAIFEVPASSISGTTITISTSPASNLTALGITTSDQYNLRLAPTLEEIFTTVSLSNGGVLQAGISSFSADVVWVPTGPGTYNQFFLSSASGRFTIAGGNVAAPNVPVVYIDGMFVQKRGVTPASLTVAGQVKTTGTTTVLGQGFNAVTVVAPAGATLANAGFEDDVQGGLSSLSADLIWIQQPNLNYVQYFRNSTNTAWRNAANGLVDLTPQQAAAVQISGAVLIQRRSPTPAVLDLNVPPGYSSL